MDVKPTGFLAREAFLSSAMLIVKLPKILIPFYRNALILIGILCIGGTIAFASPATYKSPLVAAAFLAVFAFYTWLLSAVALSTIIFVGISYWRGQTVTIQNARRGMHKKNFRIMLGDILGAAQLAVIGLLSFMALHVMQKPSHETQLFALMLTLGVLGAILSGFTALALRRIIMTDTTPGAALRAAYTSVKNHPRVYAELMAGIAAMNVVVSAVEFFLIRAPSAWLFPWLVVVGAIVSVMQILPYIRVAEHLDAPINLPVVSEAPRGTASGIAAKIFLGLGIVFTGIIVIFLCVMYFVIREEKLYTHTHTKADLQAFGLTELPRGFSNATESSTVLPHYSDDILQFTSTTAGADLTISITKQLGDVATLISNYEAAAPKPFDDRNCKTTRKHFIVSGLAVPVLVKECDGDVLNVHTIVARAFLTTTTPPTVYTVEMRAGQSALDEPALHNVLRSIRIHKHAIAGVSRADGQHAR